MKHSNITVTRSAQGLFAERARRRAMRKASVLRQKPCGRWTATMLGKAARIVRRECRP